MPAAQGGSNDPNFQSYPGPRRPWLKPGKGTNKENKKPNGQTRKFWSFGNKGFKLPPPPKEETDEDSD